MTGKILICTDLDRTLLPNGSAPESIRARPFFSALVARPEVVLAYVSGRHKALVEQAIAEYSLPQPDFVIGDVGTSIYQITAEVWREWPQWEHEIAPDWAGFEQADLHELLGALPELTLQESAKQNRFKLSYYVPLACDLEHLLAAMRRLLALHSVRAELVYSVDEPLHIGLLDVLPARATKYHAVEFLMRTLGFSIANTVFAGDSGNDLPVLTSPIQSVLVANANSDVRRQASQLARTQATEAALYLARGDFLGMNGNYSAGILEGVAYYLPHTKIWMQSNDT
ncbi:MAG: haloacid dehalogenase [Gammaproteobacteria bacterium HGW-Gammaproteobacteria-3]|nr:MAG: haloacid dehalogenase [Gammaproteobacteria bacterium HGW-Gammaproteobacteria-3]